MSTAPSTTHGTDVAIRDEIATLLTARPLPSRVPAALQLQAAIAEHVDGGKLLRPTLLLDTHAALRGDVPADEAAAALRTAAAVELLHFAFLLHDDVIDGDVVRRGGPNLIGGLAASPEGVAAGPDWARSGGILAGDLVLAAALGAVARLTMPDPIRRGVLDAFDDAIAESVVGEWLDVGLAAGTVAPDLDTVREMTRQKTAAYTFELPLRAAAVLAGASAATIAGLAAAGRRLGLAFQLQDDLLAMFGDPDATGKDGASDVRGGKQTALVAAARATTSWPELAALLADRAADDGSRRRIAALLDSSGARSRIEALVDEELTVALRIADDPDIPEPAADVLRRLRHDLAGRRA